jgi:L-lactate dehydrogenase complex protein LldG
MIAMSGTAREEMLARIKSALRRDDQSTSLRGEASSSNAIQDGKSDEQRGELAKRFELELKRIGGRFHVARTAGAVCDYIENLISIKQARAVIGWHAPVIDETRLSERLESAGVQFMPDDEHQSEAEFINKAIHASIGITAVDYALADTGTLVLIAGRGRARSASLLPPAHVAILKPQQIISGLDELIPLLNGDAAGELASAVTFITGPSRTADIELTLVLGVHGPQELHVILLSPNQEAG